MTAGADVAPSELKRALRAELTARRAGLGADERAARSRLVAARLEPLPAFRAARAVAVYAPLGAELDPSPLTLAALARGAIVAFPRVAAGTRRLAFARCAPGELVKGPLGAAEPPPGAPEVAPAEIDLVLVPGLAFSEDGLRLGRGGGHYDATLAAMPAATRVGLAFDLQLVPTLPREPHDAALDLVVTEARTLAFSRETR